MGAGRIRRVSIDTTENYTLQATETYDFANPAASPSSWGSATDVSDMDKPLSNPVSALTELTHNGCLITFARFPDFFHGCVVKLRPSYDSPDTPALELWTHDSVTSVWTRRRRIDVSNPFVGIPSGLPKIFDLRLTLERENVDMVWITLTDDPTLVSRFLAIHCFGRCVVPIELTVICDDDDPEGFDCLPPFPWPEPDPVPIPPPVAGLPPFPDLCDSAAVADYRALLDETQLPLFDEFLNSIDLEVLCADPADPPPGPPDFPPIDLCDPAAVEAYKAMLTPAQLAYFEELLATIDLPALCPDGTVGQDNTDPPAVSECDYNIDQRFPMQAPEICVPTTTAAPQQAANFFLFYNDRDKANFDTNIALESAEIQAAAPGATYIIFGTPSSGAVGSRHSTRLNSVLINVEGAGYKQFVGVRAMWGGVERGATAGFEYTAGYGSGPSGPYLPFAATSPGPTITGSGFTSFGWAFNDDVRAAGEAIAVGDERGKFGQVIGSAAAAPGYFVIERVWRRLLCPSPPPVAGGGSCRLVATSPGTDVLTLLNNGPVSLFLNGFLEANTLCIAGDSKRYLSQQHIFGLYISVVVFNERGEFLTSPQGSVTLTPSVSKTEGVTEPITAAVNANVLRRESPDYLGPCPPACHPGCPIFSP